VFRTLISSLSQLGRKVDADALLSSYEQSITGKSSRYINLCELRCYFHWCQTEFALAKEWGLRGVDLARNSHIDTKFDPSHNLALARRDLGEIEPALQFFLRGRDLADVLACSIPEVDRDGPYFGNIGRCLQLMDRVDEALICLRKSAQILESEDGSLVNRGHAALWVGEALERLARHELAYCFLSRAICRWRAVSPPRVHQVEVRRSEIRRALPRRSRVVRFEEWQLEAMCRDWLAGRS